MMLRLLLVCFVSTVGFFACDGHDHEDHEHPMTDQIAEGCKHMEFGPDLDLDLSAGEGAASAVHPRYTVSLAAEADGASGSFTWTSSGGHHYFFFNLAATMAVTQGGTVVTPVATHEAPVASCDDAANIYEFMLPAGDYQITVTSAEATMQMVIHFAGSDHGHGGGGGEGGEHHPAGGEGGNGEHHPAGGEAGGGGEHHPAGGESGQGGEQAGGEGG